MALGSLDPTSLTKILAAHTNEGHDPLDALCIACSEALSVSGAGLTLVSRNRSFGSVGVSDAAIGTIEQLEFTLGVGPCIAAYHRQIPVFDSDLEDDTDVDWPDFREGAVAAGIRAAFGFPLLVHRICIGALNLYRDEPGPLSDAQVADALVAARYAGETLLAWQAEAPPGKLAWQLDRPLKHLQSKVLQATGRISVQTGLSVVDALVLLRAHAFSNDRAISDVAADVGAGSVRFD